MATPVIDLLRKLRRRLATLRRQLNQTRESMNNIIDCEANAGVLESLEKKEQELVFEIGTVTAELQAAEGELDRSLTPSPMPKPALFHSIDSMVHHLSLEEESDISSPSSVTARAPVIAETVATRSANSASVLGKIVLPELRELCQLKDHILRFELVLREAGLGIQDPEKGFQPLPEICFSICLRFCRSVSKCPAVEKFAEDMLLYDVNWTSLKTKLLDRYCTQASLLEAYQRKLAALKFTGRFDSLLDDVRDAWRIGRVACSNPALEQRLLISRIREVIPAQIYHDTLNRLNVIHIEEWEYKITMDSDDDKSFLGALKVSWKLSELTRPLRTSTPPVTTGNQGFTKHLKPDDRAARSAHSGALDRRNFKSVLVAAMSLTVSGESLKRAEDLVKNMPIDKYRSYSSKRSRGYLIGCQSDEEYRELNSAFASIPGCKPRRFTDDREQEQKQFGARNEDPKPPSDNVGKISRPNPPSEYVIDGDLFALHADGDRMKLEPSPTLQLDSGAGLCYLTATRDMRNALVARDLLRCADSFTVTLADGSSTVVNSFVNTQLHVYPADGIRAAVAICDLKVYVLPGTVDVPHVLLGRCAIDSFDFVISKDGVRCGDVWVCDVSQQPRDFVNFVKGIRPETSDIDRALKNAVDRGWTPLLRSPDYSLRLCELPDDALRDHPDQTHAFMIKIPESVVSFDQSDRWIADVESKARGMFKRLTASHRERQAEIISTYLKAGWWKEASTDECRTSSRFAPVSAFLVTGNKKPRIVVNFVPVNLLLPESSTPSTMPAHLVAALRLTRPDCILVCDAASAFYKLRIDGDLLWIVAAVEENGRICLKNFLSDRVVFGISCGPSSLITGMQELFFDKQLCGLNAFSGWYIDDNAIAGSVSEVVSTLKTTSAILNRVGHELQVQKSFAICRESKRVEFEEALAVLGPIKVSDSAKIFNATMMYAGDEFLEICCADPMRRVILERLGALDVSTSRLTKADFFKLAGVLSYDLIKCHAEEKCIADSIRSLIGREFASHGWYTPLLLNELTPQKRECLELLILWSRDLYERSAEFCSHRVKLPSRFERNTPELNLHVDASTSGGGFVISIGNDSIWMDAWRWSDSQVRWHINFQELTAILRGVRIVSDIIHCFVSCFPKTQAIINVFSDNRSAVKWSTLQNGEILSRHQSRRTLMRMVDELADEWRAMKAHAVVRIEHVKGALNVKADQLSRIFDRKLSIESELSLAALLEIRSSQVKTSDDRALLDFIDKECHVDGDEPGVVREPESAEDAFKRCDPDYKLFEPVDASSVFHSLKCREPEAPSMNIDKPFAVIENFDLLRTLDVAFAARENPKPNPCNPLPFVETASSWCYDMTNLRFYVDLMVDSFRSWRNLTREERGREAVEPVNQRFELIVARSAQMIMERRKLPIALREDVGPMTENDGVYFYRIPCPDGTYRTVPFIPAKCTKFQHLFVRDRHRDCAHMGVDYTQSRLTAFACHRVRHVVTSVIKNCLFCQRKAASRHFKGSFEMIHDREGHMPYESIAVDHFALGDKTYALSIMCLTTGHLSLSYCGDLSADSALKALRRILFRYCVKPKFVLADNAANLKSCIAKLDYDVEFSQTTSHSQFENGKLERMHAVVSSVLTYKIHYDKIRTSDLGTTDDPFAIQDLLDYASCQLNQRPLGLFAIDPRADENRVCLTPHLLVFGNVCAFLSTRSTTLDAWIKAHYDVVWRQLKMKSDLAVRGKPHSFYVGECVLIYKPSPKFNLCWTTAHVVDIIGNRVRVIDCNGKETLQNAFNVCPLRPVESLPPCSVTRIGARIEYTMESEPSTFLGRVIDENSVGLLLIEWDGPWPREWLPPSTSVRFLSD